METDLIGGVHALSLLLIGIGVVLGVVAILQNAFAVVQTAPTSRWAATT